MLIGMGQWIVTISWFDVAFAITSLNQFSAAPRELHLQLALRVFGYLKKCKDCCIGIDLRPLHVDPDLEEFKADF